MPFAMFIAPFAILFLNHVTNTVIEEYFSYRANSFIRYLCNMKSYNIITKTLWFSTGY